MNEIPQRVTSAETVLITLCTPPCVKSDCPVVDTEGQLSHR